MPPGRSPISARNPSKVSHLRTQRRFCTRRLRQAHLVLSDLLSSVVIITPQISVAPGAMVHQRFRTPELIAELQLWLDPHLGRTRPLASSSVLSTIGILISAIDCITAARFPDHPIGQHFGCGIRSRKLRSRRSSFQTISVSPSCNALRQRSRAGRFVVAPDKPSSLKTVLHPARFKAASCKAVLW
jgi:hypothetical protein